MAPGPEPHDEAACALAAECQKLQGMVDGALKRPGDLPIPEIVSGYFQVISVRSHIEALKRMGEIPDPGLPGRIMEAEALVSGKFNKELHPRMMSQLARSIDESAARLQSGRGSGEGVEGESRLYDMLREKMSTMEFAEQYDRGLAND